MEKINLADKFESIDEYWSPGVIGEVNEVEVKLAKVKGEFERHYHENNDELFYVVEGKLKIEFSDKVELLEEGEMIVVPHGVEHKPVAEKEAQIMLVEPKGTKNTGNIDSEMTIEDPDRI